MSVTTLFDKILGLQQQRSQATFTGYRELVAGLATGEEPSPTNVERLLAENGKSVDDLRRDVDRYQRRMAHKAMVAAVPRLESERREIDAQIAAADRLLEAAEKQHDDTTMTLYHRRRQIDLGLSEASNAAGELLRTCDDVTLRREAEALDAEARQLHAACREAIDRATYMEEKTRSELARADYELTEAAADARREVAERYRRNAEQARGEVKRLEKAQAELEKRRRQLEHRLRQW